jgi:primosomal protein N' (replication factor Y)
MMVAQVRPLRLRQERAQVKRVVASHRPFASVLVDHGIFHMQAIFDYLVPGELGDQITPGQLVEVPFHQGKKMGLVLSRNTETTFSGKLKEITKCLTRIPYCGEEQLVLFREVAAHLGAQEWDFIRASIPPFSRSGESAFLASKVAQSPRPPWSSDLPKELADYLDSPDKIAAFIQLPLTRPYWEVLAEIVLTRSNQNTVLLIVPTVREREHLAERLEKMGVPLLCLKSDDLKGPRYQAYLEAKERPPRVIIGTRSSIFLVLPKDSTIIVFEDQDESHFEQRSPNWNSRKIAELRGSKYSILFTSLSPSLEVVDAINEKKLLHYRFSQRQTFTCITQQGNIDEFFPVINKGLKGGSVLICMGNTGYINSFGCQKCKNTAICVCGGKLYFSQRAGSPLCSICTQEFPHWKCAWCGEAKPRIIAAGLLRKSDELARAFPKIPVITSHGEDSTQWLPEGTHLVISTYGVEPRGRYSAMAFLDLEQQVSRADLRGQETMRENLFRNISMLSSGGDLYISLPSSHSLAQDIIKGAPYRSAERELDERNAARLPPKYQTLAITGSGIEATITLLEELRTQCDYLEIIGPYLREYGDTRAASGNLRTLLIKCKLSDQLLLIGRLHDINRVNSLRGRPLFSMKIDPYSLA